MVAVAQPVTHSSNNDSSSNSPWPGEVWEVYNSLADFIGYLVSEAGDVNLLVAFIQAPEGLAEAQRPVMLRAARRIAQDPSHAGRCQVARDLRQFCTVDSPAPIDPEVYGWYCGPVGGGSAAAAVRPMPYCRFRLAAMLARHNELTCQDAPREQDSLQPEGAGDNATGHDLPPPEAAVLLSAKPLRVCRPPILAAAEVQAAPVDV